MKQHITVEQLNELSEEQKEKLFGWYHRSKGIKCFRVGTHLDMHDVVPEKMAVSSDNFTIGQMIEFLDEHNCDMHTCRELPENARYIRRKNDAYTEVWSNPKDLCDALWETVKEVLKAPKE